MALNLIQGKQINVNLTGSFSGSFTGNLIGSASFATSSSFATNATSASQATSASYSVSSSVAISSSFSTSGSYSLTSSFASIATSASFAISSSTAVSSSFANNSISASFATTASYVTPLIQNVSITGSLSQGSSNRSVGPFSFAQGVQTIANSTGSHAQGFNTVATASAGGFGYNHAEGGGTTSIGEYSHAEGQGTLSIGQASHAEGDSTSATGLASHAEGSSTQAIGQSSHAEGSSTQAIGQSSHAEGFQTQAVGDYSHAEGVSTISTGQFSHAEGETTEAVGTYSHAEGRRVAAQGEYSHAEGNLTAAIGFSSHAEGNSTRALGYTSHAEGIETKTGIETAFSIEDCNLGLITVSSDYGDVTSYFTPKGLLYWYDNEFSAIYGYTTFEIDTVTWDGNSTLIQLTDTSVTTDTAYIGDLTYLQINQTFGGDRSIPGPYSHAEGQETFSIGIASHAEGNVTYAFGQSSHVEGAANQAVGNYSHAEGSNTVTYGNYSHTEGDHTLTIGLGSHAEGGGTITVGDYSHAEGNNTVASGSYSHAEGLYTTSSGLYSHAEGRETIASGLYSHAEGYFALAEGEYSHAEGAGRALGTGSHAEGNGSIAVGDFSHAEGGSAQAIGFGSHAEGFSTRATGSYSHTEGWGTIASGAYQHVQGIFNIPTADRGAFILGNGTNNTNRSNLIFASGSTVQVTGSVIATQGFTGSLFGTSSWASNATTASYVLNAVSSSFASTASLAPAYLPLAGGTVSGSLTITNNLTVIGSASIQYISESTLNIGTNLITVNTLNPGARFGGLAIIDSGSSPQVSASFLYDSVQDEFIFVHRGTSTSAITSSHFVLGPETYNDLGNETYLTANRIPKGKGNEHLNDSNILDNGSVVSINSNSEITGSLRVTQGITGSLFGTSSWSISAISSSYPVAASSSMIYTTVPSAGSTGKNNTILLGANAGGGTTSIYNSNFIGISAGQSATNAYQSNFIGAYAGAEATRADNSNFIGLFAGYKAVSASFSTLIGWQAGQTNDPLLSIGSNNIIIGTNITLPSNTRDSINLGGIIFATGSYSNVGGFTYSGSQSGIGRVGINKVTPEYTLDVSGSGNYSNGLTVTGSLIATSSWATNAVTASYVLNAVSSSFASTASFAPNYVLTSVTSSMSVATASFVQNAQSASYVLQAVSSSFATTASFAANGGVTQIIAGTNITITPTNGLGAVTINSVGGGSGAGANITGSFTNQSTWTFVHGLGNRGVVVQTFDTSWNQIIPQNIALTDSNTATITFPSLQSGFAIATLGGTTSIVNAVSASFATTASFVNTLNQNVIITGSLAIGTGSIGGGESNLVLGPAPAGGTGEGGQIGLLGTGGSYTSSSFIDTYQNQIRIIAGQGTASTTGILAIDLGNKNAVFQGAVTASGFNGLPNDYLYAIRSGSNQTVGSAWANTDVIFNSVSVSKGISFNTSTGVASLTGGKVYRVTARLAWSAAAAYNLQFSCYTSANVKIGPDVEIVQSSNGTSNISDGTLEFIYAPAANTDIKIRCTGNNTALSGEQIRADLNTQFIIQQIA